MTSLEVYKRFLLKLNKNDTNTRINISKGEFVLVFNEQKRIWLNDVLDEPYSFKSQNILSDLYVPDVEIEKIEELKDKDIFKVPENFEELTSSYSIAKRRECIRKLYNFPKNPRNRNTVQQNTNDNPSFDFEETFTEESKKKLIVYKTDFSIDKQLISYYREPIDIDIEGYITISGEKSKTINPDIKDASIDDILNRCIVEVSINYENAEQAQMSAQRIQK
jgi:hypothetical protein